MLAKCGINIENMASKSRKEYAYTILDVTAAKPKESLFSGGMAYNILVEGCLIGALSLAAYTIGRAFFDPRNPLLRIDRARGKMA